MKTRLGNVSEVFYELHKYEPKNILHIGGHLGEEGELYKSIGSEFTFIEPVPEFAKEIKRRGYKVIQCAVGERGERDFIVRSIFSSFYQRDSSYDGWLERWLGEKGIKDSPEIIKVKVRPLSDFQKGFDTLVLDAEGAELEVLKSGDLNFRIMIIEVKDVLSNKGGSSRSEIEDYIFKHGYIKAEHIFKNAIYIKK